MALKNQEENNPNDFNWKNLPRPQQLAVSGLAVFAVVIIVFWVWQIQTQISQPFAYTPIGETATGTSSDLTALLKSRDTDGDGLSDYDELYVYKTSPYLEDTDSDGISDKQEIAQGTDPACPQGKNCSTPAEIVSSSTPQIFPNAGATTTSNLNATGLDQAALQKALNGQVDAATLRQLLISSGANPDDLDKISDEDLMKGYSEALKNQSQSQNTVTP